MLKRCRVTVLACAAMLLLGAVPSPAVKGDHSATGGRARTEAKKKPAAKGKLKPFSDLTKNRVEIDGLFTFYLDTTDNSVLMAVKPEHFGPIYLWGVSRSQGDGQFYDNAAMGQSFPFYFKRVGKKILLLEKNLRFRADSNSTMLNAVKAGVSDALLASLDIKSEPDKETKAVLVDPSAMFIQDIANTSFFLGQGAKTGFSFDRKNSYYLEVKSFPQNSEITVRLHFRTTRPVSGVALQNPYSFFHTYHHSLSVIPETDYVPRIGDERVGYFMTLYEDYTSLDKETPYVRYIDRWHLKKLDPEARLSEPVKPIVYWIENTVPEEYRDAIAEGIECWNYAFEKAGFKNAIVAKQMPDTATWDPEDMRYSVVRWMVQPGAGYAVGPHRANPFTGEILDADIRISSDFIRFMYTVSEQWIEPVTTREDMMLDPTALMDTLENFVLSPLSPYTCRYAEETMRHAAFGLAYLQATQGDLADKSKITKEYLHAYLVELVAHEVGHTLGLRHNFAASTIHTLEEISDREFTRKYGVTGSVMDYGAPNLPPPGYPQGEYYNSRPGPYDNWAIEYGYTPFGAESPEEELPKLQEIASRCTDPYLVYATDEDAFGTSMKSIDPRVHLHDMGADPLAYAELRLQQTDKLWTTAIKRFEQPGERYQKLLSVFSWGWGSYAVAARVAPKYIGGIYHYRNRIGDPNGRPPFEPVPAEQQRRAMALLRDHLFAPDAFDISEDLLNKLEYENLEDFTFSAFTRPQVDFPLHQVILRYQNTALYNLYSPFVLGRLLNNLARLPADAERYTMYDLFTDVRKAIWSELDGPSNVNSIRRQLQLAHLTRLISIYLSAPGVYPLDARSLAANDLEIIEQAAIRAQKKPGLDGMTRAHFGEVVRQIQAARNARREYSF